MSEHDFNDGRPGTVQAVETSRRFHRFGAFASELQRQYRSRAPGTRVADMYQLILDRAALQ